MRSTSTSLPSHARRHSFSAPFEQQGDVTNPPVCEFSFRIFKFVRTTGARPRRTIIRGQPTSVSFASPSVYFFHPIPSPVPTTPSQHSSSINLRGSTPYTAHSHSVLRSERPLQSFGSSAIDGSTYCSRGSLASSRSSMTPGGGDTLLPTDVSTLSLLGLGAGFRSRGRLSPTPISPGTVPLSRGHAYSQHISTDFFLRCGRAGGREAVAGARGLTCNIREAEEGGIRKGASRSGPEPGLRKTRARARPLMRTDSPHGGEGGNSSESSR